MEVIVGKTSGFCGGVIRSVLETEKVLDKYGDTYCLGELVHNKQVVDKLVEKGLNVVNSFDDIADGSRVIIRAHGIAKEVYDKAKEKNLEIVDLTCLKVIKIHELAEQLVNKGYFIVLAGQKSHPESIGTISFCGKNSTIIESLNEIDDVVKLVKDSHLKKVAIIAQTTYSMDKYDKIADALKVKLSDDYELEIQKTICNATELRQRECKELAGQVDAMIIIGGRHSSNTIKLYDIATSLCKNSVIVETADELEEDYSHFEKVGVMAGASTPKISIDEVIGKLESRY